MSAKNSLEIIKMEEATFGRNFRGALYNALVILNDYKGDPYEIEDYTLSEYLKIIPSGQIVYAIYSND